MADADRLVIDAVREDVLDPEVVSEACELMLADLTREADHAARRREAGTGHRADGGGDYPAVRCGRSRRGHAGLLVALRSREARRVALVSELAAAPRRGPPRMRGPCGGRWNSGWPRGAI